MIKGAFWFFFCVLRLFYSGLMQFYVYLRVFSIYFKEIGKCFEDVSKVFFWCSKGVSRVLHCYSLMFQGYFTVFYFYRNEGTGSFSSIETDSL